MGAELVNRYSTFSACIGRDGAEDPDLEEALALAQRCRVEIRCSCLTRGRNGPGWIAALHDDLLGGGSLRFAPHAGAGRVAIWADGTGADLLCAHGRRASVGAEAIIREVRRRRPEAGGRAVYVNLGEL